MLKRGPESKTRRRRATWKFFEAGSAARKPVERVCQIPRPIRVRWQAHIVKHGVSLHRRASALAGLSQSRDSLGSVKR